MKSLLFGAALLAIARPAVAADMPVKARMAPIFSWFGCYVGGTAGGFRAKSDHTGVPSGDFPTGEPTIVANLAAVSSGSFSQDGFIGGGETGCNVVANNGLVFGFEFDISDWHLSQSSTVTGPGDTLAPGTTLTATTSVSANWLSTFRPRFGFTHDHWLFYATGGVALANVSYSQSVFFNASGSTQAGTNSGLVVGWTAGVGVEYAVTNNWSIKGEYLYADLGNQSLNEFNPGFPTFTQYSFNDIKISIVRFGLNYRF
jgi:outer membrane immunogenic protein